MCENWHHVQESIVSYKELANMHTLNFAHYNLGFLTSGLYLRNKMIIEKSVLNLFLY